MVCVQQAKTENTKIQIQLKSVTAETNTLTMEDSIHDAEPEPVPEEKDWLYTMDSECEHLQLKHLAGGNIVRHPPLFAENDNFIFLREDQEIFIYSIVTGEPVRHLLGATSQLVSMEFELNDPEILVACTVKAEVLRWQWRTGTLQEVKKLNIKDSGQVIYFNLINVYNHSDRAVAFVCYKSNTHIWVYYLVDTSTGNTLYMPCSMRFWSKPTMVVASNKHFNYLAIIIEGSIIFLDYKKWRYTKLNNSYGRELTTVCVHPSEHCVATGDVNGQILLWRQFMDKSTVVTSLYHWHHTPVTSIAFSEMGTSFYSSGQEAVLVRWNVAKPEDRTFLPRMNSVIRHIAVQQGNTNIAVCTEDNGVQFLDANNKHTRTLQEFTFPLDDKTNLPKFPVGFKNNPRSNTLVFNGRIGHLQFYSVYSRSLLYNLNITNQNILSMERNHILYNIRVTKAAFNIDWMATGEVCNDLQHMPELRLKFWNFNEQKKSYELNTNIEMPHEGGFRAIEFSNCNQVDNLLCATVGEDYLIRIWALQNSDNIYRQGGMCWGCIAQTNYKNMPIETIGFSQDGSLLAAGYGNTLCIYVAESLKLKAALNCTAGWDGNAQKARISLAVPKAKGSRKSKKPSIQEQRHRLLQTFQQILEPSDSSQHAKLFNELCAQMHLTEEEATLPIKNETRELMFNRILRLPELNLYQKLQIFQKLNIRCEVRPQQKTKLISYIKQFSEKLNNNKVRNVEAKLHLLSLSQRYKAKHRLQQYRAQQKFYDAQVTRQLVPLMSVLGVAETTTDGAASVKPPAKRRKNAKAQKTNAEAESEDESDDESDVRADEDFDDAVDGLFSLPPPAQITHIQFGAGEYAYLVLVCTKSRVLIWNLLTFRVHAVLKISVEQLAFDPQTNLIAAYTSRHDLNIFQINVPLPLYQRSALPKLAGLTWMPRRFPKATTINIDWQSVSTLYMLTEDQSIKYLGSSKLKDDDVPGAVSFKNPASHQIQYTTFGTYATKQIVNKQTANKPIGQLIITNTGKSVVKAIVDMANHTMPPLSLLCGEFVRALVKPADAEESADKAKLTNGMPKLLNGHSHSDSEDEEGEKASVEKRKTILAKSEELTKNVKLMDKEEQLRDKEQRLQKLAKETLEVAF